MKQRCDRFSMIAHQMMRGCNRRNKIGNVIDEQHKIDEFKKVYAKTIKYLEDTMPKSVSVGVCGAMGKAILWYGHSTIAPFVEAFAKRDFKGVNDPVHVLWDYLINHTKRNQTNNIYRRTVTAIRMFLRNSELCKGGHLKAAGEDFFDWDDTYKVMTRPRGNVLRHTDTKTKQSDESILAEVEKAFSNW